MANATLQLRILASDVEVGRYPVTVSVTARAGDSESLARTVDFSVEIRDDPLAIVTSPVALIALAAVAGAGAWFWYTRYREKA
jgi:hypothetical protein